MEDETFSSDDNTLARCTCGGQWWIPVPHQQPNGSIGPAFALEPNGNVSGYAASFVCMTCDMPFFPITPEAQEGD